MEHITLNEINTKEPRDKYCVIYLYEVSETVKLMKLENVIVVARGRRLGEMRSCLLGITFQIGWRISYISYSMVPIAGNMILYLSQYVIKIELMGKLL